MPLVKQGLAEINTTNVDGENGVKTGSNVVNMGSFATRGINLHYVVSVFTTEYQFVLQSISLYQGVSVCTTE